MFVNLTMFVCLLCELLSVGQMDKWMTPPNAGSWVSPKSFGRTHLAKKITSSIFKFCILQRDLDKWWALPIKCVCFAVSVALIVTWQPEIHTAADVTLGTNLETLGTNLKRFGTG